MSACRSCGADLMFGRSKGSGRLAPLDVRSKEKRLAVVGVEDNGTPIVRLVDTYLSHFAVCDDPERFRKDDS